MGSSYPIEQHPHPHISGRVPRGARTPFFATRALSAKSSPDDPITRFFGESGAPRADAAAEGAKITALRTEYKSAVDGRKEAMQTSANRRAARDVAKEDFLDVFAKVGARVREVFPRDRVMQDLFFDSVATSASAPLADDESDDEGSPVDA